MDRSIYNRTNWDIFYWQGTNEGKPAQWLQEGYSKSLVYILTRERKNYLEFLTVFFGATFLAAGFLATGFLTGVFSTIVF